MKFLQASDLHYEFEEMKLSDPCPEGIDAVLLAGDIWTKGRSIKKCEQIAAWAGVPVIFTPGNHDYYADSMWKSNERMAKQAAESDYDIRFLNPGVTMIGGTRIIAATLWTDYRMRDPEGENWQIKNACHHQMNDHKRIRWGYGSFRPVTPDDLHRTHMEHRAFITETLATPFDGATIVMTHHAPSEKSVGFKEPEFVDHAYASNLEDLILEAGPDLWIHGHTHNPEDYSIGRTRVMANPKGYPDQDIPFDFMKVHVVEEAEPHQYVDLS